MRQLAVAVNGELLICTSSSNQRCSVRSAIPGWAHFPFGDVPTQVTDRPQRSIEGPAWILALRPPVHPSQRRSMRCGRPHGRALWRFSLPAQPVFRVPACLDPTITLLCSGWPPHAAAARIGGVRIAGAASTSPAPPCLQACAPRPSDLSGGRDSGPDVKSFRGEQRACRQQQSLQGRSGHPRARGLLRLQRGSSSAPLGRAGSAQAGRRRGSRRYHGSSLAMAEHNARGRVSGPKQGRPDNGSATVSQAVMTASYTGNQS